MFLVAKAKGEKGMKRLIFLTFILFLMSGSSLLGKRCLWTVVVFG